MNKMRRRSVFLYNEAWNKMEEIAKREGATPSDLIRRAIYEFLKARGEAQ